MRETSELCGDTQQRQMVVHDRTRLIGRVAPFAKRMELFIKKENVL